MAEGNREESNLILAFSFHDQHFLCTRRVNVQKITAMVWLHIMT